MTIARAWDWEAARAQQLEALDQARQREVFEQTRARLARQWARAVEREQQTPVERAQTEVERARLQAEEAKRQAEAARQAAVQARTAEQDRLRALVSHLPGRRGQACVCPLPPGSPCIRLAGAGLDEEWIAGLGRLGWRRRRDDEEED